ncbi:MAG: DUF2232 domain-containing protein [Gammaproteobacteria bacterium]|jgi:hypothetical protein|nr:DUF2232 domain-containing protein [Gammaproteobacteria bacterium]MBT3724488.1 DUF2232 domain-containing protein [Gammaproteobacteria bacterium]MBT4076954.1 DUF2232 domain-containing protein [Gammaproteobacteria bacterium]MBT4194162.1 DUF2232 domain-containing protein [Gammaproteobacteria bacterium]MBT4448420.1 DUF2232 domain-containing protein [Gammaproteobacteria bacterium]
MLAIARYALKSPFHASTIVGFLAILSLFVPLVSILSGAIVGLIILTQGLLSGARALLISVVGITVVSYLVTQSPELGITIGLVQWIPIVVLAEILRRTRSMSFTLVSGMVIAMFVVLAQYIFWPDIDKLWAEYLQLMFQGVDMGQQGLEMDQIQAGMQDLVHWMVMVLVAVMYSTFIGTLMASRWFQARLAGSEGFRDEFYTIKLGRGAAIATILLAVISFMLNQDMLIAMLMVMLATFLYQGLAIVHNWSKRSKRKGWLVLLYVMMVIFPQVVAATAFLGVIDNWTDFRARLRAKNGNQSE